MSTLTVKQTAAILEQIRNPTLNEDNEGLTEESNEYELSANAGKKQLQRQLPDDVLKAVEPVAQALRAAPIKVTTYKKEVSCHYTLFPIDGRMLNDLVNAGVSMIAPSSVKGADIAIVVKS